MALDQLVVDLGRVHLLLQFADARQHAHDAAQAAHFFQLPQLRQHVLQVELTLLHAFGQAFGLILGDGLGGLLDQADDIAHAQNAVGHPFGMEILERVDLFPDAKSLDRLAGDRAHRQGGAAAGVAIDPRQHNAGQADLFLEITRRGDRVLAGHGIGDQQGFHRLDDVPHRRRLGHHRGVDRGPPGGVQEDHVEALQTGRRHRPFGDGRHRLALGYGEGLNVVLLAQQAQLLARRRPVDVKRGHHHFFALALLQAMGQFGGGGGFPAALQADHQDRRRRCRRQIQRRRLGAQHLDQIVMDDLDHLLAGRDRTQDLLADGPLAHLVDEGFDHVEGDIGFQQGDAHFAQGGVDVALFKGAAPLQPLEHIAELAAQSVEHGHVRRRCSTATHERARARTLEDGRNPLRSLGHFCRERPEE